MYDEFLDSLPEYLKKYNCHPIKAFKITEDIFYVLYFDKNHDCTNYYHFYFVDHIIRPVKLQLLKSF
jgi:hypothetical protein